MSNHITKSKILLVDDDTVMCSLLSSLLGRQGFQVRTAGNGQEGVKTALTWLPDLILMDLMMPVMDGFEAAKTLGADPRTEHIPIVGFSGAFDANTSARVQASGMKGIVAKSSPVDDLFQELSRYLPSSAE